MELPHLEYESLPAKSQYTEQQTSLGKTITSHTVSYLFVRKTSISVPRRGYLTLGVKQLISAGHSPMYILLPCILTHWGCDKMATILQMTFSNSFYWMEIAFGSNVIEVCSSWGFNWQVSIGSDNGLAPCRWQAVIWTNDDLVYWRVYIYIHTHIYIYIYIYTSLGLTELR